MAEEILLKERQVCQRLNVGLDAPSKGEKRPRWQPFCSGLRWGYAKGPITNEVKTQGVPPFRYVPESTVSGMTALAGLPPYLELAVVSGMRDSLDRHLQVCSGPRQGWTDKIP